MRSMTLRTRLNRIFLTGLVTLSLISTSLTGFAQETDPETLPESIAETDTGTVTIPITQTWNLNGVDKELLHDEDMTVHYTIVQDEDSYNDGKESVDPATFDLTDGDDPQEITFTAEHAGVFTYRLTAESKDAAGYTYDTTTYTIRHYVKNTADGGLETFLTAENEDGRKVSEIVYDHVFTPVTTNDPPVEKVVDGDVPESDGLFHFAMKAVSPEDAPLPAIGTAEITTRDHDIADVGEVTFTEVGTYVYEVSEVKEDLAGYTYDTRIYTVTYEVTEAADHALASTRTIEYEGEIIDPDSRFTFTNTYKASRGNGDGKHHEGGGPTGSVMIYKVDAADVDTRLAGARFIVTRTNGDYVKTITTDENGMAAMDGLLVGTYRLKEFRTPDGYTSEDRYVYFDVVRDTTSSNPTNVKVTNTKAASTIHMTAVKQWANVDGATTPDYVTFALVRDGVTTDVTQIASAANDWTVDFGLLPADGAAYSVTEVDVPENYSMSIESVTTGSEVSYTITNTYVDPNENHQNRYTGDDSRMMLYAGMMGATVMMLGGWFVMMRRRER